MQIAHSPDMALYTLAKVLEPNPNSTDTDSDVDLVSATYLLSAISNVFGDSPVEPGVSEVSWTKPYTLYYKRLYVNK